MANRSSSCSRSTWRKGRVLRNYSQITHSYDLPDSEDKFCVLHVAAFTGIRQFVDLVLDKWDVNVNTKTSSGETALHWAARNGHEGVVRRLLEHGADVNARTKTRETALHKGALNGHE